MSESISRVPDQIGVSLIYIMLEIYHSGREPSIYEYMHMYIFLQRKTERGRQTGRQAERERERERERGGGRNLNFSRNS